MSTSVAYLVGRYPAPSHAFITREVDGLRARGVRVVTMSLQPTPARDLLTEADRTAAAETFVVQRRAPSAIARAHLRALRTAPATYVRTLARALRDAPGGARALLWHGFYFAEAIIVWEELDRLGVRHVHAHFANAASSVAMYAAAFGHTQGMRWSLTMHGPTEFDDVTRHRLALKTADAEWVACISHYCRSQLMKLTAPEHWDKLRVVRCGLDPAQFAPADHQRPPGAPLTVLCVGRLVPDKGQALLLDALGRLRAEGHDVRLRLVGDGEDRPALEAQARRLGLGKAVTFAGSVGQDRIAQEYRAADVFCLPSLAEGVPVVLMEAMACGLPVVATRIMGIPELVEDGESGLLVAPGRAEALAGALAALLADPDLRRAYGSRGRTRVLAQHDIAGSVDKLLALLTEGPRAPLPADDGMAPSVSTASTALQRSPGRALG